MRGTPFGFSGWHLGLNTIDSPFTLVEGETRECLNVVSTERGAIKKRTGSVQFVSGIATNPSFPNLTITDSFNRNNEKPLSGAGKWEAITGAKNTGEILSKGWTTSQNFPGISGALWNEKEQATPAVSVKTTTLGVVVPEYYTGIWCCLSKAAKSGYFARWEREAEGNSFKVTIEKWEAGVKTVLATATKQGLLNGDSIGISLTSEIIRTWRKTSEVWSQVVESPKDAKFTTGFSGIEQSGPMRLNNFAVGSLPAGKGIEEEITSLAYVSISGTPYLIATTGKNIYSINSAAEVNQIGEGFTAGSKWSIVQFNKGKAKAGGPVYLENGLDTPQTWTGAEAKTKVEEWKSEEAEIEVLEKRKVKTVKTPKGKYMTTHLNRLWIANTSGSAPDGGSTVRCCEANEKEEVDPSIWPEKNYIQLDPEDGYEITGLGQVGPYVLVFKPYKCWVIHAAAGINPIAVRQLSENTGCISHRSITETPMGTFFLTADQGVYLTNGSRLTEMSYKVRPTLLAINPANREKAAGAFYNNHYYISFPTEGTLPNKTLDYDVALKSWWLHDIAGNQWVEAELNSGEPFLYIAKPKTKEGISKAFVAGVFTDVIEGENKNYVGSSANGLSAFWISPWEPFFYFIFRHRIKAPFIKKRVREFFFDFSGELSLLVARSFSIPFEQVPAVVNAGSMAKPELPVNAQTGTAIWGEGEEAWGVGNEIWGGSAEASRGRAYALGVGTEWSFGFGNASKEPFEVTFAALMAQFRKS